MATGSTPVYALNLPEVGADDSIWGGLLNSNWSKTDQLLSGLLPLTKLLLSGSLLVGDGTVSLPALAPASDVDTGIYKLSAGVLGFASNGMLAAQIDPPGNAANSATTVMTREKGDLRYLPAASGGETSVFTMVAGVTDYPLAYDPGTSDMLVFVGALYQRIGVDYTIVDMVSSPSGVGVHFETPIIGGATVTYMTPRFFSAPSSEAKVVSFSNRAALVSFVSMYGVTPSYTYFDGIGWYFAPTGGSTDISDLPGLAVQGGSYIPDYTQFASLAEVRAWSTANNRLYRYSDGNLLIGQYGAGHNGAYTNAPLVASNNITTAGTDFNAAISGETNVTYASAAGDFIGVIGTAIMNMDPGSGTNTGVIGVYGRASLNTGVYGDARGGYLVARMPNDNTGAVVDGMLYGAEIKVVNAGGSVMALPSTDPAKNKVNIFLVGGDGSDATDLNALTAGILFGTFSEGWHTGIWMRNSIDQYIYMEPPLTAGGRAINLEAGSNWADDLIVMPLNKGIASWDAGGTVATMLMRQATDGYLELLAPTKFVKSGNADVSLSSTTAPTSGTFANLFFEGLNSSGSAIKFASIIAAASDATAGSEDGSIQLNTYMAGANTLQMRVRGGVSIGSPTGVEKGVGTLNVATAYYTNGAKVVGARDTGWAADTGTSKKTANATYSGTASAGYVQAEMTAVMNALRDATQTIKALKETLAAHGLTGA